MKKFEVHGFTLIEILVSMTIIGFLFSFGYASFRDFSRRQALAGVVKQVQGDLRLAQQKALSGEKPSACVTPTVRTLDAYNFYRSAANAYIIRADCSGLTTAVNVKSVTLPAGVVISAPSPNPIKFKVLGQGTNCPIPITGTGLAIITLTQAGFPDSQVITVTAGGEIK